MPAMAELSATAPSQSRCTPSTSTAQRPDDDPRVGASRADPRRLVPPLIPFWHEPIPVMPDCYAFLKRRDPEAAIVEIPHKAGRIAPERRGIWPCPRSTPRRPVAIDPQE